MNPDTILLIIAAICFGLAALGITLHPRLNLVALGLLLWVVTLLVQVEPWIVALTLVVIVLLVYELTHRKQKVDPTNSGSWYA